MVYKIYLSGHLSIDTSTLLTLYKLPSKKAALTTSISLFDHNIYRNLNSFKFK